MAAIIADLRLGVDPCARTITEAEVARDAVCGRVRHRAERLAGCLTTTLNSKRDCSTTIV